MAEALINIHVIIAEIIACILCAILVCIVFCQTIYYLCIHKLIRAFYSKDETNLTHFQYSDDKHSSKMVKYDDIHPFFRITTSISMIFCFISSISSLIAITHLMITGSLAYNLNYVRHICFISWLFSHYSMSSVFVGRLYVSFKDSIFQYSLKIIHILSISLACLPILLIISFLFWLLENSYLSLIFFISFIAVDVAFSIILTWLFIQKLYQLIKGRIMTTSYDKTTATVGDNDNNNNTRKSVSSTSPGRCKNSAFTIKTAEVITSNNDDLPGLDEEKCIGNNKETTSSVPVNNKDKDITPYLGPVIPIEPTFKMELASIADESVPPLNLNPININTASFTIANINNDDPHTPIDDIVKMDDLELNNNKSDSSRDCNSVSPKTVRFHATNSNNNNPTNGTTHITRDRSNSRAKRYKARARSISRSISTYTNNTISPRQSKAFIKAKKKLDEQQLQLINSITRHGLLLFLSSVTSLTCLIYIMFTFQHYESNDINDYKYEYDLNKINIIAYYYLYWNMGISSFLNALSLYLSFVFAEWFYQKICNKIHKWLEAFCLILIVKRLKKTNPNLDDTIHGITR